MIILVCLYISNAFNINLVDSVKNQADSNIKDHIFQKFSKDSSKKVSNEE